MLLTLVIHAERTLTRAVLHICSSRKVPALRSGSCELEARLSCHYATAVRACWHIALVSLANVP